MSSRLAVKFSATSSPFHIKPNAVKVEAIESSEIMQYRHSEVNAKTIAFLLLIYPVSTILWLS